MKKLTKTEVNRIFNDRQSLTWNHPNEYVKGILFKLAELPIGDSLIMDLKRYNLKTGYRSYIYQHFKQTYPLLNLALSFQLQSNDYVKITRTK